MRIITGRLKGRRLETPKTKEIRPTMGRTREAVFSILTSGQFIADGTSPIEDAHVLDLFCGSGSLGFEALSRGASLVTFIDKNRDIVNVAKQNAIRMNELDHCQFICSDSTNLPAARRQFNLVFLDPPYHKECVGKALGSLVAGNWLEEDAIIVAEMGKKEDVIIPPSIEGNLTEIDSRIYGITKIRFYQYKA